MNIIICGAGEIGGHTAEVLTTQGHSVTIIDTNAQCLRNVTESLDIRTLEGNAANSTVLCEAGARDADVVVAATNMDEVNLVAASVGRALGARRSLARLHHSAFLARHELSYEKHFGIDQLLCPEYSTATAIAGALRNPAALAVEEFAGGQIHLEEFSIREKAPAVDIPLQNVHLPPGTLLAAVSRGSEVFLPTANTHLQVGDRVVVVGDRKVFDGARKHFRADPPRRREVVLMGGTPMAVWLCRALHDRTWSVRLFEMNHARARELAVKLDWVTVLNADPTDKSIFAEERIGLADVCVALHDHDEDNIVGAVLAKAGGVTESIAVVQKSRYLDLLSHIGVDHSYSPGMVTAKQIVELLDDSQLRLLATLGGQFEAWIAKVNADTPACGRPLKDLNIRPYWVIGALRRGEKAWVPGALDVIKPGDLALVIGRQEKQVRLRELFTDK